MIINLLRLLLGFVEFEASGGFPERFLNLCTINGITLWNVQNDGVKVKACTSLKGYQNIRKSARKSGMKVKITRKRGAPFFIRNNKVRAGILVGISVAVLFLVYSSCVLWDVEVSGNEKIKSEALLESLENNGVKIGVFKSRLDTISIEGEILREYPDLAWVSINIFGTKAVLEIKENTAKPEIEDDKTPMNIVAEKDGQIVLIQGHRGTNAVKEGDVVVKGDLLISGVTTNSDGSEKTVRATGKVFAKTQGSINVHTSVTKSSKILEATDIKVYLYLLGIDIPLSYKSKGEELYNGEKLLKANNTKLPFGVLWDVSGSFGEKMIELTDNQATLLGLLSCVRNKRVEFGEECKLESVGFKKTTTETEVVINCKIEATEDIAIEKEFYLE